MGEFVGFLQNFSGADEYGKNVGVAPFFVGHAAGNSQFEGLFAPAEIKFRRGNAAADVIHAGKRRAFFRFGKDNDKFVGAAAENVSVRFQFADFARYHADNFVDARTSENLQQLFVVVYADNAQTVFQGQAVGDADKSVAVVKAGYGVFARSVKKRVYQSRKNYCRRREKKQSKRGGDRTDKNRA